MFNLKKFEKTLGVAKQTRRYDLPLNKGNGGNFLKILIALMTFLAMLGLASTFALSEMTDRWSSGLNDKATIEVPAKDSVGTLIDKAMLDKLTNQVYTFLKEHPAIDTVEKMSEEDIITLVAPWLGDDLTYDNIPLPGIISVSFKKDVVFDIASLEENIRSIAPQARLDTHESWLQDVLRFTGALNFAALLITIVIGITTVVAVAGAVQSRMAIYHEELELLHLMGAADEYISRQLQRYMLFLALQGAAIGAIAGGFLLFLVGLLAGEMDISLLPDFTLSGFQTFLLIFLPLLVAFLGMLTARHTVLRVLAQMP